MNSDYHPENNLFDCRDEPPPQAPESRRLKQEATLRSLEDIGEVMSRWMRGEFTSIRRLIRVLPQGYEVTNINSMFLYSLIRDVFDCLSKVSLLFSLSFSVEEACGFDHRSLRHHAESAGCDSEFTDEVKQYSDFTDRAQDSPVPWCALS